MAASIDTIKFLLIAMALGRIMLLAAAYKDERLLKAFFYYEVLIEIASQFIPKTTFANHDAVTLVWMLTTAANFTLLYCDFKLSLCASLFSLLTFQVGTLLVFDQEYVVWHVVLEIIALALWLVIALTTIHLLTFTIGRDFKKLRNAI